MHLRFKKLGDLICSTPLFSFY